MTSPTAVALARRGYCTAMLARGSVCRRPAHTDWLCSIHWKYPPSADDAAKRYCGPAR